MCHNNNNGGARVQNMPEGLYGDFERAEDMESVQWSPLRDIRAILCHLLSTANKQGLQKPSLALACSFLSFKPSLEVKMCWLAYLLAMESHFALHYYHVMTRRVDKAINSLLCKFYVIVNYIPTCLCRQLLNSAATIRCTRCYQTPFSRAF